MAMGMSADEYWNGDPYLAQSYYKRQKILNEQKNQEMWLQGMYIYNAFTVCLANAFAKKGSKAEKYPEKPYEIYAPDKETQEAQAKKTREEVIAKLSAFAYRWNANHKQKGSG